MVEFYQYIKFDISAKLQCQMVCGMNTLGKSLTCFVLLAGINPSYRNVIFLWVSLLELTVSNLRRLLLNSTPVIFHIIYTIGVSMAAYPRIVQVMTVLPFLLILLSLVRNNEVSYYIQDIKIGQNESNVVLVKVTHGTRPTKEFAAVHPMALNTLMP